MPLLIMALYTEPFLIILAKKATTIPQTGLSVLRERHGWKGSASANNYPLMKVDNYMTTKRATPHFSLVLETPAPPPEEARHHFFGRLAFETDVADLMSDLQKGITDFIIIDTRSAKS